MTKGWEADAMTAATAKKILLVDDDAALRQSLSEQLRLHEEFATVEVETGGMALDIVKTEYFDAILLDVGLPDMDAAPPGWVRFPARDGCP